MTVRQLRKSLEGVPGSSTVVFQANIPGGEDKPGKATYTTSAGTVFGAFQRTRCIAERGRTEFVIDGAITQREM